MVAIMYKKAWGQEKPSAHSEDKCWSTCDLEQHKSGRRRDEIFSGLKHNFVKEEKCNWIVNWLVFRRRPIQSRYLVTGHNSLFMFFALFFHLVINSISNHQPKKGKTSCDTTSKCLAWNFSAWENNCKVLLPSPYLLNNYQYFPQGPSYCQFVKISWQFSESHGSPLTHRGQPG